MTEVILNNYNATSSGGIIRLGTYGSYGIEQIKVIQGTGWENLVVTATFVTPQSSVRVVVPSNGIIDVPQESTANPLSLSNTGKIVFIGTSDGVFRISTDIKFIVLNHAPVEGRETAPTPSEWEQFVSELKGVVDAAVPPTDTAGLVLHSGGNAAPNYWAKSSGGGGSSVVIVDEDSGKSYTAQVVVRNSHAVLILTEKE